MKLNILQPKKINRPGIEGIWIGLNDRAKKRSYLWEATGQSPTFTNWNSGEPNNCPNKGGDNVVGEDCAHIVASWGGKWNDLTCVPIAAEKQNTFCEKGNYYFKQSSIYPSHLLRPAKILEPQMVPHI